MHYLQVWCDKRRASAGGQCDSSPSTAGSHNRARSLACSWPSRWCPSSRRGSRLGRCSRPSCWRSSGTWPRAGWRRPGRICWPSPASPPRGSSSGWACTSARLRIFSYFSFYFFACRSGILSRERGHFFPVVLGAGFSRITARSGDKCKRGVSLERVLFRRSPLSLNRLYGSMWCDRVLYFVFIPCVDQTLLIVGPMQKGFVFLETNGWRHSCLFDYSLWKGLFSFYIYSNYEHFHKAPRMKIMNESGLIRYHERVSARRYFSQYTDRDRPTARIKIK